MSLRQLILMAACFSYLECAHAQLVDRVKHYEVRGTDTHEFIRNWHAIQRQQGFVGYCWWQPKLKHGFTRTKQGYRATNLNLKVFVILTLPRVQYPDDMPLETRRYFSRQIQAIYDHEYTHRKYKMEFYKQFVHEFNQLPVMPNAGALFAATNQLLWKLYNNTKAKDALFDRNGHK